MIDNRYYKMINGEPMVSAAGMALLVGIPAEEIEGNFDETVQRGRTPLRPEWIKNGIRRRKECAAAIGHEPSMVESLDFWAAQEAAS